MLRFAPQYRAAIWGGRRLADELERELPEGRIAESWELVDLGEQQSRVARGAREGEALGELWRSGVLGGSAAGGFPFLLKWLDTHQRLSVQVHPDEAACERLGTGQPKSEAWFVASADPGATILLGHYPGLDAVTLRTAAEGGTIQKWMYETRPRPGEMFYVPAGTMHAIGAGLLLLEVQEPSDSTFRVYDWGRVDDAGEPRDLHIEQACEAIDFEGHGSPRSTRRGVTGPSFSMRALAAGATVPADRLRVFVGALQPVTLHTERGTEQLGYGDVVVAEPADGEVRASSDGCVLISEPSQSDGHS